MAHVMDSPLIESENLICSFRQTSAYLINSLKGRITSTNSAWLEKILDKCDPQGFL